MFVPFLYWFAVVENCCCCWFEGELVVVHVHVHVVVGVVNTVVVVR